MGDGLNSMWNSLSEELSCLQSRPTWSLDADYHKMGTCSYHYKIHIIINSVLHMLRWAKRNTFHLFCLQFLYQSCLSEQGAVGTCIQKRALILVLGTGH